MSLIWVIIIIRRDVIHALLISDFEWYFLVNIINHPFVKRSKTKKIKMRAAGIPWFWAISNGILWVCCAFSMPPLNIYKTGNVAAPHPKKGLSEINFIAFCHISILENSSLLK